MVANVGLAPRLASPAYNWNTITIGWAFAVIVAVYVSAGVSGAHLNPAVTIALAVKRGFSWSKVPTYILGQFVGAFLGALGVYLVYMEGLQAAGMPNVWCTGPGSVFGQAFWGGTGGGSTGAYSLVNASIAEIVGTAVLLMGVLASGDERNLGLKFNMGPFLVGGTVLAIGLSLGGPSGYAINPARDLGPRIFGALVGTQGLFDGHLLAGRPGDHADHWRHPRCGDLRRFGHRSTASQERLIWLSSGPALQVEAGPLSPR
ncbi:MAG: putative glycerol uptake facilitator protein [Bellilinea sp.]|nr:MAG: putative glycerol uptake facilitator protein [Bellilinea sp.]